MTEPHAITTAAQSFHSAATSSPSNSWLQQEGSARTGTPANTALLQQQIVDSCAAETAVLHRAALATYLAMVVKILTTLLNALVSSGEYPASLALASKPSDMVRIFLVGLEMINPVKASVVCCSIAVGLLATNAVLQSSMEQTR